jgi:hypothetical protein
MAMRITPDAELATPEAVKTRIAQLERDLGSATGPSDKVVLSRRIKALKDRLSIGGVEKTATNAALLKSKNDLR